MSTSSTPGGDPNPNKSSSPPIAYPKVDGSASSEDPKKWGTHVMGTPSDPTIHPDNQKAALWNADDQQQKFHHHHPYLQYTPVEKPSKSPCESIVQKFNSWSAKTESLARNIWHNLNTGSSVSSAAMGKLNLTVKAISEGGFESLYKQTFATEPDEKLKKSFACYLSTTTGPVAGTLYLSTVRVAFCSDRPLSFTAPSGQVAWCYYQVVIPWANINTVHPINMPQNPQEKYIQIATVDRHDFWFMGFVSFDKASENLANVLSSFRRSAVPA